MNYLNISSLLLAFIFIFYGLQCLFSQEMKSEFNRFKLTAFQRQLTGILQLLGALGLFLGIFYQWLGLIASAGLGILMLLGFIVRVKIKDNFWQTIPSLFFMVINFVIIYLYIITIL